VTSAEVPLWLLPVAERVARGDALPVMHVATPPGRGGGTESVPGAAPVKRSSILILFGEGPAGPDLLLVGRATGLRQHGGQPAFPGGGAEAADADAIATALREAREETGLDPDGVVVLGTVPDLWLPVSSSVVTPVVAWWAIPSDVDAADPYEVSTVARVPLQTLADPAARGVVVTSRGKMPAFEVEGLVIWGFTGDIVSALLRWLDLERPWDDSRTVSLPPGDAGWRAITVTP